MTAKLDKMNLSEGGFLSSVGVLAYSHLWDEQRFDSDSSTVQQSKAGHEKPQVKSHLLGFPHTFLPDWKSGYDIFSSHLEDLLFTPADTSLNAM